MAQAKPTRRANDDTIDALGDRVHAALQSLGAIGARAAVPQADVAVRLGISTRQLQDATLRLNERGVPVVSSCVAPFGVFLARTSDELARYDAQLRARMVGTVKRRGFIRRLLRQWVAMMNPEPGGQGRLFA